MSDLLLKEFEQMNNLPIMEIEYPDEEGEYEIYTIYANINGLECRGINKLLEVKWDDTFSLDEHLQSLYELCSEDMGV